MQLEPLTESEKLKLAEAEAIRTKAALQLEEQRDEVKRMNQMLLYSKCAAIRQVSEALILPKMRKGQPCFASAIPYL